MKRIFWYASVFILGGILVWQLFPLVRIVKKSGGGLAIQTIKVKPQSIGFLPYWLLDKADKDYSRYLTEMTYFSLTVNPDGTIQKFTQPGEAEPGWYALTSGKYVPNKNLAASLAVFNGDPDAIDELIGDPVNHAKILVAEIGPVMEEYGFTKLNVDLENVRDASESARQNFTAFIKELKKNLNKPLTIDASPTDLVKPRLINLAEVAPLVEQVILMTYDYHYSGSMVTGPVAPNFGAGVESEFDTATGIQKALEVMPAGKIILGIPLYGYEWETLTPNRRAAVLPGSGIVASNRRVEEFLAGCSSCSAQRESLAGEAYLIYQDQATDTYHQFFYPDEVLIKSKIDLVKKYRLSGLAFWAIGYDGRSILDPVAAYLK